MAVHKGPSLTNSQRCTLLETSINVFLWIIIISLTLCSEIYHSQDCDDYFVNMCCVQSLTKIKKI